MRAPDSRERPGRWQVHGRQRGSQRHGRRGPADLAQIAAVKRAVAIPVIANGNVTWPRDVLANLESTGADGIMSAEGVLANPVIFEEARALQAEAVPGQGRNVGERDVGQAEQETRAHNTLRYEAAKEYVDLGQEFSVPFEVQQQHLSNILGLSAATRGAGWVQRKFGVEAGQQGAGHQSEAGAPPQGPPRRMREMKQRLLECQSPADLQALVQSFLGAEVYGDAAGTSHGEDATSFPCVSDSLIMA